MCYFYEPGQSYEAAVMGQRMQELKIESKNQVEGRSQRGKWKNTLVKKEPHLLFPLGYCCLFLLHTLFLTLIAPLCCLPPFLCLSCTPYPFTSFMCTPLPYLDILPFSFPPLFPFVPNLPHASPSPLTLILFCPILSPFFLHPPLSQYLLRQFL